jgi:hypothetical protein
MAFEMTHSKLVIVSHFAPSVINFRGPLIQTLCSSGVNVHVLAPDWNKQIEAAAHALGASSAGCFLSRTGLNPLADLFTLMELMRLFKAHKPDVVFTYAAKTNVWGILAAALAGVPHRVAMVEGMGYAFTAGASGRSTKQRIVGAVMLGKV